MNTKSSILFKQLKYFILFSAFPCIILFQNISFYFFLILLYKDKSKFINLFRIENIMDKGALLFIFASIISVIFSLSNNSGNFIRSIQVLPNYLYWGVLIIVLPRILILNKISLYEISKFIVLGIVFTILSYFPLQSLFDLIPVYQSMSQNSFAFLLIIFSPLVVNYFQIKYKSFSLSIFISIILTLCGFLSGSRSGSILVLFGSFTILLLGNRRLLFFFIISIIPLSILVPNLLETQLVKGTVFKLNERTYELIYGETGNLDEDLSFLTRLAMIEKGKVIFSKYPFTGVGLNNFTEVDYDFKMDFEGGELLNRFYDSKLKSTNPHNSYLSFISEGGILLFIPVLFLMFYPVYYFFYHFKKLNSTEIALFLGIICMCIHSYFIAGMINSFAWLLISLAQFVVIKNNRNLYSKTIAGSCKI